MKDHFTDGRLSEYKKKRVLLHIPIWLPPVCQRVVHNSEKRVCLSEQIVHVKNVTGAKYGRVGSFTSLPSRFWHKKRIALLLIRIQSIICLMELSLLEQWGRPVPVTIKNSLHLYIAFIQNTGQQRTLNAHSTPGFTKTAVCHKRWKAGKILFRLMKPLRSTTNSLEL